MNEPGTNVKLLSSFYGELNSLRAAISNVPLVGTYIDLNLSMPGQKYIEERLEYLIAELRKEMEQVQEAVMDNAFLKTEEGYDLITKVFTAAAKTRQKDKLKLFAKVLRGAYTRKINVHDPELYVKIIDELTARELEIAMLLYRVKTEWKTNPPSGDNKGDMLKDPIWFSTHYPEYSKEELEFSLPRLERTGLIKEQTGTYSGNLGSHYNPTPLIAYFVKYIEENE